MKRGVRSVLAAAAVAIALMPGTAAAATFVVNDTGNASDSNVGNGVCRTSGGVCTLRAAIQEANATTALDTINFEIGTGPKRINITSSLPTITRPVIIDGWTQPGFSGVPLIEIHGTSSLDDGIRISGGGSTLRGLIINAFGGDGVFLSGPGGNVLEGNYIGLTADGTDADGNGETGIRIESPNNRIGGKTIPQRNVVSGNRGRGSSGGIYIVGASATGNVIQGNFIGLDAAGLVPFGNEGRGVAIHDAPGNYVGGVEQGAGNLIAGNRATGVRTWGRADGNFILGNWIGVNRNLEIQVGLWPEPGTLSNARGVQLRSDENFVAYNYIAGNTYDGVLFFDGSGRDYNPEATASRNVIYSNIITKNGMVPPGPDGAGSGITVFVGTGNQFIANSISDHPALLGINLTKWPGESFFMDAIDHLDADEGPNGYQNYPVLLIADTLSGSATRVAGYLHSKPNGTYTITLYGDTHCSWTGFGEGRYPVTSFNVDTDADGNGVFDLTLPYAGYAGWAVSATAMDSKGNTSEFSGCITITN